MPLVIDKEKCTGCGECVEVCPVDVLEIKKEKCVLKNPDECIECRACEAACTNGAISLP